MKQNHNHVNCPECTKAQTVIPFYYGLPTIDQILKAKAGSIALGNASLWPERPTHTCTSCLVEFNLKGITGDWVNPFSKTTHKEAVAA